jgi:hypothetical protein
MQLRNYLAQQRLRRRWRAKKAAWRRARYPELYRPRARLQTASALLYMAVWKHVWLYPLHTLHLAGLLDRDQLHRAAFSVLRNPVDDDRQ